jgi:hypothetical protein
MATVIPNCKPARKMKIRIRKKKFCRKEIRLYFFISCNPSSVWHPSSKKSVKGTKNSAKKRYTFSTPGKKTSLRKKTTANPIKTVKMLITELEIKLLLKTSLGEYFPLHIKKTDDGLMPKLVNIRRTAGNIIAKE